MRISSNQMQNTMVNAMGEAQLKLSKTQLQLASGRRLLSAADDPAAAVRAQAMGQAKQIAEQYQTNIGSGRSRLNQEEGVLSSVGNILQRVRELALQGNNGAQDAITRADTAVEVRQLLEEMVGLANSQDANGEYLFAGFQSRTQPFARDSSGNYTYSGDQGQRFIQIGATRQVAVSDPGSDLFQGVRNGNGIFTVADNPLNSGSGIINTGSVTNTAAYDNDSYSIALTAQTPAVADGATVGLFNDSSLAPDSDNALQYELEINGTVVYSQTEADPPLTDLNALAAAINDDVATTGVRAYVGSGGTTLYLGNSSPNGQSIDISERMIDLNGDPLDSADRISGYFGTQLSGDAEPLSSDISFSYAAAADSYVVIDSLGNVDANGAFQANTAITFNGISTAITGVPNIGDSFNVKPSINQNLFQMVENVASVLEGGTTVPHINNVINSALEDLSRASDSVVQSRAAVGARLNVLDNQQDLNSESILSFETTISSLLDLDYAEAATRLNLELVGLQAAQQAYVRLQGLSLFNFL
ncbi:MAG: flagellar hook-associated protein 3 [Gammaproteobacteria bacterium]|nr:flagellar hook-associated protein 3 [Gammaproteobacteria bacterium]